MNKAADTNTASDISVVAVTAYSDKAETGLLTGLARAGVKLTVLCAGDSDCYRTMAENGISVVPLKIKGRFDKDAIRTIAGHVEQRNARLLHLFNNRAVTNGVRAAAVTGVPVVAYRGIVDHVSVFSPYAWMTYLNPRVKRVSCVSEGVRQYFLKLGVMGIGPSKSKFVTIYKGHDVNWYRDRHVALSVFGIPDTALTAVTVANFRPKKGVRVLVEAMRYLPEGAEIHFLLVGNMADAKLQRQIRQSPFRDRIHLTGFRKDAAALIRSGDIYVLPSSGGEGLPKVVIEAMAYARPCVVTDVAGASELIQDGRQGLVVPPKDPQAIAAAIMKLYRDPALRRRFGDSARERLQHRFHVNETIRKTLQMYRNILS